MISGRLVEEGVPTARAGRVAALAKLLGERFTGLRNRARPQEMSDELKKKLNELGYVAH